MFQAAAGLLEIRALRDGPAPRGCAPIVIAD
jgi:hypothetical protein